MPDSIEMTLARPWDEFVGAAECRVGEAIIDRFSALEMCPFAMLVAEQLAAKHDVERAAWILQRAFEPLREEFGKRLLAAVLIELGVGDIGGAVQLTDGLAACPVRLGDFEPVVPMGLVVVAPRPSGADRLVLGFDGARAVQGLRTCNRGIGLSVAPPGSPTARWDGGIRFAAHEINEDAFRCAREAIAAVTDV